METRYIKWNTNDNGETNYIRQYRKHFWNKWKTVIDPRFTKPQLYRAIKNTYIAI